MAFALIVLSCIGRVHRRAPAWDRRVGGQAQGMWEDSTRAMTNIRQNFALPVSGLNQQWTLADRPVGRLLDWRPELSCALVRPLLIEAFSRQFDLALRPPQPHEALEGW